MNTSTEPNHSLFRDRSQLWNCYVDNSFSKKTKILTYRFYRLYRGRRASRQCLLAIADMICSNSNSKYKITSFFYFSVNLSANTVHRILKKCFKSIYFPTFGLWMNFCRISFAKSVAILYVYHRWQALLAQPI